MTHTAAATNIGNGNPATQRDHLCFDPAQVRDQWPVHWQHPERCLAVAQPGHTPVAFVGGYVGYPVAVPAFDQRCSGPNNGARARPVA